ncbi:hypothetical protein [Zunongwangia sp. HGR-M22]|uniref:hypothetical protein n=1 Tax=Zunongwangia sp. HGR-M22 TaxID=3015168 RepID=UPI0022DE4823|nr:hypothetical protein [Zunongwangia sp. HGR-M22]WBL26771.1 hypothetical protein PBT91_05785 [Zunongwangia sp. HGR-M22]
MTKSKHIEKIKLDDLESWFRSTGYLCPFNELELRRFNKLYEDYDFKLKSEKIDPAAIIEQSFLDKFIDNKGRIVRLDSEIEELKMVARKGTKNIPQSIIDKMRKKHKKDDNK